MKTMTVREDSYGRKAKINAKTVYQMVSGDWVAEVDKNDFQQACDEVCKGVENCACENLRVQTDLDDDGREYTVLTN